MSLPENWTCDGIPKDGKSYPDHSGPHPVHQNNSLDCEICGLPKEAMQPPKAGPQFPLLLKVSIGVGIMVILALATIAAVRNLPSLLGSSEPSNDATTVAAESPIPQIPSSTPSPTPSSPTPISVVFSCDMGYDGQLTTVAKTMRGTIPVIRWRAQEFGGFGFEPQTSCQEVSRKFQEYYDRGSLNYLTTGENNRRTGLCAVARKDASCPEVLVILRKGRDPNQPLSNLIKVDNSQAGEYDLQGRLYINMEKFLQRAPVQ